MKYKKVLLHERKRHTARRVVTTPSVVLTGYPPFLTWPGGYPTWVPPGSVPPSSRVPPSRVPPGRVPPSRVPPRQGTPRQGTPLAGYPPAPAGPCRVPPPGVCPMAFWEMLQSIMGYGYPLWTDRLMEGQTRVKTLPSRRTTYAGGKNTT